MGKSTEVHRRKVKYIIGLMTDVFLFVSFRFQISSAFIRAIRG
jgi:hypothetical protein